MSCGDNGLIERLQNSKEKLANLGKKVDDLENKNQALVEMINAHKSDFHKFIRQTDEEF